MTNVFLTDEHFQLNLAFPESDLSREWKHFLSLFVKKSPKCPEHPTVELTKTFEKVGDRWVGKLSCMEKDYEETWTWPRVIDIWSWGSQLGSMIQEKQIDAVRQGKDIRQQQINDLVGDLLSGKPINIRNEVKIDVNIWEELGGLEQTWSYWLRFQEMIKEREISRSEMMAKSRLDQFHLLHEREKLWNEWITLIQSFDLQTQEQFNHWGETVGWAVLEHEGIPTPRRLNELKDEAPKQLTVEMMEVWFKWSNVSRDYMGGMKASEEVIRNLTEEGKHEEETLKEYYVDFPERGVYKNRGERQAIGEDRMKTPGLFMFEEDAMKGYEKMEELMEDPDEVIDGPKVEPDEIDMEEIALREGRILKDQEGSGLNELDENFLTQPEKEKINENNRE